METLISQLAKQIAQIKGAKFASITYLSKSANELAEHTIILGFSYIRLVEDSITELEIMIREQSAGWSPLKQQAANEVLASLQDSLTAHRSGTQNPLYTKKGQYIPIGNGVSLNSVDNTLQLFGLAHAKKVLVPGTYKTVKSRPLTIEKDAIRKALSVSKFKEFALDETQVAGARLNGETLEMVRPS